METMQHFKYAINNLDELPAIAQAILNDSPAARVYTLFGSMGSGKTTLVKELCKHLGVKDLVTSPSFTILNEYYSEQQGSIYHFDFYRIKSESEAFDLGYEDYFYSGNYCFIEWPEKIPTLIPAGCGKLTIEVTGSRRNITLNYE
jgi:tRNA threonylcarbamoyladenosine biosynthesis protein TsaE